MRSIPVPPLRDLISGCWVSQAISVAARLGIADLLYVGPKHYQDLAAQTATHPESLYRLLRALTSVGVFAEDENGRFMLTPSAEQLRTDAADSLHAFAVLVGEREHWTSWQGLLHSVQTGQAAFQHEFGMPFFDYLADHPEASQRFDKAMTSRSATENMSILESYDFAQFATIIDVGGGEGSLTVSILNMYPQILGIVVDLAQVAERCAARARRWFCADRLKVVAGDFRSGVPDGGDIYVLKKVIHDWGDESAAAILRNCWRVMSATSRLLLIEPIIPAVNQPSFNKLLDLLMLVWHSGGRERTVEQHKALLSSTGFDVTRVISTRSDLAIIEAVPAS